jgi:NADPH:quinone reductase-like Zn-dependent oxidoreductase
MKAIVREAYGSPEVLHLIETEEPVPSEGQVLVEVRAASVNPLDWHGVRGAPFVARLSDGLRRPKDPRLGADIAGNVVATGNGVTEFREGDEVFGTCAGGFAEYAVARVVRLVRKPVNRSFEEAAAVPVAAITALQGLRNKGKIKPDMRVLVNGASGGVGTFAIQVAKFYGTEVTGVCSSRNLELVRSIGADHVVDYTKEDFTRSSQKYDLIFDAVGNRSVGDYKRALKPGGQCVIAGFTGLSRMLNHGVLGPLLSLSGSRKVGLMGLAKVTKEDLVTLRDLLEGGKLTPVIDRRYPLEETAKAIAYLEQGHARGKVVITMRDAGRDV